MLFAALAVEEAKNVLQNRCAGLYSQVLGGATRLYGGWLHESDSRQDRQKASRPWQREHQRQSFAGVELSSGAVGW